MSDENKETKTEKPDPYKKYKDFQWQNPEQFKNGPIDDESRKCRDCICCIIFILLFILFLVVVGFGFVKGQPMKLLYFYDSDGKACGHDEGYEEYPYLYFTNVINGLQNFNTDQLMEAVCVKVCPDENPANIGTNGLTLECKTNSQKADCIITKDNYYESKPLFQRICFPKSNNDIAFDSSTQTKIQIYDPNTGDSFTKIVNKDDTMTDANQRVYVLQSVISGEEEAQEASARLINLSYFTQLFTLWINDLNVTKWAIAGSIGWSFLLAMFFFLFIRCCAGFITFLIILLVEAGLVVLAVYFKFLANSQEEKDTDSDTTDNAFFWVFTALAAAWLIFILIMCNRIRLAVALTYIYIILYFCYN